MSLQFDHFVHLTPDPTAALEAFADNGLHAVQGGRHEDLGTYNTLSYFEKLSYVELIGVFDEALARAAGAVKYSLRDTFVKNDYVDGPQRIALRSNNLQALAEHFKALDYEVNGPIDFSRKRPDGSLVTWKLLFAGKPDEAFNLPFFIEWDESDDERQEDLKKRGAISDHSRGQVSVDGAAFAVASIDAIIDEWATALKAQKSKKYVDAEWNATAQRLLLPGGDIIFYEPNGEGTVQQALANKPGLFALQLNSSKKEEVTIYGALYRFK